MSNFLLNPLWLVAVPVLIHLINMLRHRRVEWAAMEFLLLSQKKNRTWIMLKQLMLLLVRMTAVAVVVIMLAKQDWGQRLAGLLGDTQQTHHIVLLDDSFSMSDRSADPSAFDKAKDFIHRIGKGVGNRESGIGNRESGVGNRESGLRSYADPRSPPQALTLLRFSRARRVALGTQPDLHAETIDPADKEYVALLEKTLHGLDPSQTSAGPIEALRAVAKLPGSPDDEHRVVYLVSDFRTRDWGEPTDLQKQLVELNEAGVEIRLVNCVDKTKTRRNLAITSLVPSGGIRAAGVPLFMEVTVRNFAATKAREVSVLLTEDGHSRPAVTIPEIPPGRQVTERFQIRFPTAGEHLLTVSLAPDPVSTDNLRHGVLDFSIDVPVLLIDGDADAWDARFLARALTPGGSVRTGIRPQIETPRYLSLKGPSGDRGSGIGDRLPRPDSRFPIPDSRLPTPDSLDEFQAIYLANVDRLDKSAIDALEQYVAAGGGVAIFLGDRCGTKFINDQLYRGGEGLFPLPVAGRAELLIDRLEKAPDLQVGDHPIFRCLADERYGFISTVMIHRYFAAPDGWQPDPDSSTRVIAHLRNGAPLAVERPFGKGRVVALMTTAAPVWNNWAKNPSFVIAMQTLQAYLSRRPSANVPRQVASPLELQFDAGEYMKQVRFGKPDVRVQGSGFRESQESGVGSRESGVGNRESGIGSRESGLGSRSPIPDPRSPITHRLPPTACTTDAVATKEGLLAVSLPETDTAGIYEARLTRKNDKTVEVRHYAFNVDATEGDLDSLAGPQLATRLEDVKYTYQQAESAVSALGKAPEFNLSEILFYVLVVLLIGEQLLAYSCGYHPPSRPAAAKGGVR